VAEEVFVPGLPDPDEDGPNQVEIPELLGNSLCQHESRRHWPYDRGCDACVQARGRTPARRRTNDNQQPIGLAADYTFLAGRHWRLSC